VSRILDETGSVHSLREPLPLRTLADAHDALGRSDSLWSDTEFRLALASFLRLWSRGYGTEGCVTVKATSSAGRLAVPILSESGPSRAIYMNLRAEPYLRRCSPGRTPHRSADMDPSGCADWNRGLPRRSRRCIAVDRRARRDERLAETWAQRSALACAPAGSFRSISTRSGERR
jgi:hypothetical protein